MDLIDCMMCEVLAKMSVVAEQQAHSYDKPIIHGNGDKDFTPKPIEDTIGQQWAEKYTKAPDSTQRRQVVLDALAVLRAVKLGRRLDLVPNTLEWRVAIGTATGTVDQVSYRFGCSRTHVYRMRQQHQRSAV